MYLNPENEELEPDRRRRIWYVLHVKPRTEKKAFEFLKRLNVFRYLPLLKKVSKVQRRKVVRYLPLFPGYVFTRLNADERFEMVKTHLVVQTIEVQNARRMIHQLRQIAHASRFPEALREVEHYVPGDRVRIKAGPFMGIEGCVQRKGSQTSLVLELEIIGRAVEVTVSPVDLEKV